MRKFLTLFILMVVCSILFSGAVLKDFKARSDGDSILIEWETLEESNVNYFAILRRNLNGDFVEIKKIFPKGSNSYYSYRDDSAFKTTDKIFVYKLEIVSNNSEKTYSREIYVTHNVSSVKRTWGSIKAMFR